MTIVKAIEIQTIHNDHNPNYTDKDREEAHQLSIEALKRCRTLEQESSLWKLHPLPGETKE